MDGLTLPLVFLAGIASFASPCFLPIVPVFVASLLGREPVQQVGALAGVRAGDEGFLVGERRGGTQPGSGKTGFGSEDAEVVPKQPAPSQTRWAVLNSVVFVSAFTALFVGFWFVMAVVGYAAGAWKEWLRIGGGAVLIILGLYMTRLLSIPFLDAVWQPKAHGGSEPAGFRRSALMGFAFGAGWSPCIGPVLGAIIGLALNSDEMVKGLGLMLVYSAGLGLPFVLLAAGATRILDHLTWFTRHSRLVGVVSGALLIVVGFLMITDLLAPLAGMSWINV